MNNVHAIHDHRMKRFENSLENERQFMRKRLPIAQRFGASVMTKIGFTFESLCGSNSPSAIRINAYREGRKPTVARRIWAGLAASAILIGGYEAAAVIDTNYLSCEGSQTATLGEGGNLESIAKTIPHENTPLSVVMGNIAGQNPDKIGTYSNGEQNLDSAKSGVYTNIPTDCNALLKPIVPIG